jgi:hypothetical protein
MAAIATNADGNTLFLALEDGSGNPVIVSAARSDLTTWTAVYEPGAGSAANLVAVPSDADAMLFYGNFGTDVTVIKHTISTGTNTDISPSSLGAKEVNTLAVNPSNADEIVIGIDTDQDLEYTDDGGTTWTEWDNALGGDATALWVLWSGAYFPHRYFVGLDNATTLDILYSPNEGASDTDVSGATVGALTNISALEATES